jgi:hypothetical protein
MAIHTYTMNATTSRAKVVRPTTPARSPLRVVIKVAAGGTVTFFGNETDVAGLPWKDTDGEFAPPMLPGDEIWVVAASTVAISVMEFLR